MIFPDFGWCIFLYPVRFHEYNFYIPSVIHVGGVFVAGVHPKLLFTNRHAIRSMHIHTGDHAEYMPLMNSKAAVALDFDYMAGEVFYSDIDEKKLFKFSLPTADQESDPEKVRFDDSDREM